jgi:hypothetical protein
MREFTINKALVAEFDEPAPPLAAARALAARGFVDIQAYSPVPLEGMAEVLPSVPGGGWQAAISRWTFFGGLFGAAAIFVFQTWSMAVDWKLDVGGRPLFSWPAFVVATFECTILGAGLSALVSFLVLSKLPWPHHPIFNLPAFERASADRIFVEVGVTDVTADEIRHILASFSPLEIHELRR